jgi:hypothetical protein
MLKRTRSLVTLILVAVAVVACDHSRTLEGPFHLTSEYGIIPLQHPLIVNNFFTELCFPMDDASEARKVSLQLTLTTGEKIELRDVLRSFTSEHCFKGLAYHQLPRPTKIREIKARSSTPLTVARFMWVCRDKG